MIREYFSKALKRWGIPLVAVVPDLPSLSQPTMLDFEQLFKTTSICSDSEAKLWHYDETTLVAMGLGRFMEYLGSNEHRKTLFVTHESRVDVMLGFLSHSKAHKERWGKRWKSGLILAGDGPVLDAKSAKTGNQLPSSMMNLVKGHDNPVLYTRMSTYDAMAQLTNYTAKLNAVDRSRTTQAIKHYEKEIDFDLLLS